MKFAAILTAALVTGTWCKHGPETAGLVALLGGVVVGVVQVEP